MMIRPALVGTAAGLAAAACYVSCKELLSRRLFAPAPALLTKASYADPSKVGDCPFSQIVRIAYHLAGKPIIPVPVTRDNEGKLVDPPFWLMNILGGGSGCMPCLAPNGAHDGSGATLGGFDIAAAALPPSPADKAALAAEDGLFSAIAKFVKNTDAQGTGADVELRAALTTALAKLEAHLTETGSAFFGGATPGLSDAAIAAKLYVISIAAAHYKAFALSPGATPNLVAYQERIYAHPAFVGAMYEPADAITGWGLARGDANPAAASCELPRRGKK